MIAWSPRLMEWEQNWLVTLARANLPRWADRTLHLVTHAGGVACTLGLPAALLLPSRSRRFALILFVANIGSHLVVQLLKRTVARPRPSFALHGVTASVQLPDPFSFPSGHACAATAVAVTFLLARSPAGWPLLSLAILVGFSRIYLRVHYPSDVAVGHLIGGAGACSAWLAFGGVA